MPAIGPVFVFRFVVTVVNLEVWMAAGKLPHEVPEGMYSPIQSAMNEKDFATRLSFQNAQKHAKQRRNADSRREQHQRTLMFLGQIDEKFSAGRPDFKLSPFLGAFMQKAGDEAFGFLLYADTKVIFA